MRVVIAGAGSVGRSIARELIRNGHQILLIDKDANTDRMSKVPDATWLQADACEVSEFVRADPATADVVVAVTGGADVNSVADAHVRTEKGGGDTGKG